jgi:Asp/Glu/hydantoin racemase
MAESTRPARLWYQSFVHPVEQAPYITQLQGELDAAAGPGIKFEVHGLDPPDHLFHPLTEFRCAAHAIRNALEAERAGYDAFVIGHFQEPGLLEIRGALEIPVIGLGEANLLAGLSMGGKLGLVTIDPIFIDWHERQVRAHGLERRVAGVRAIHMDLPAFMSAFTDDASYAKACAHFVEQVRPLVAAGAEVIIPAGGLPMLLLPVNVHSSSTARWYSTASRSWQRPPRWRLHCAASPDRWSVAAALTPRRPPNAWRNFCAIGGDDCFLQARIAAVTPPRVPRRYGPPAPAGRAARRSLCRSRRSACRRPASPSSR